MGMFDTVRFECPKCKSTVEHQSKAGKCDLIDYPERGVPLAIAADISGESAFCSNCQTEWRVCGLPITTISMYLEKVS